MKLNDDIIFTFIDHMDDPNDVGTALTLALEELEKMGMSRFLLCHHAHSYSNAEALNSAGTTIPLGWNLQQLVQMAKLS